MTNSDNTCLNASSSSPFHSEVDPIMIAAHKQTANSKYIRWRYCSDEPVEPVEQPPPPPTESNSSHALNLIALGRTGDGKSSLLNDLIGKQVFKQKISAKVNKRFIYIMANSCYLLLWK